MSDVDIALQSISERLAAHGACSARTDMSAHTDSRSLPKCAAMALRILNRIEGGGIEIRLPDGRSLHVGAGGARSTSMQVRDWRAFETAIRKGDIGFAEAYIDGWWDSDDLAGLLGLLARSRDAIARALYGSALHLLAYRLRHFFRANTKDGSRRNVMAHYDLGNGFYSAWLDETMSYSAALFDGDTTQPMAQAQVAKYRRILDRLSAPRGSHILEVGCGWGGFAEIATLEYGLRVSGITLSPAQHAYAVARAEARGFADSATFELRDYRDVDARYDHVVSIEMFEAVGERYWPNYFTRLREFLKPGGRAVIQVITIADELFERYRRGTDFIQRYVFPGGMLPSPSIFRAGARAAGLGIKGEYAFGVDYAHTLARWRASFDGAEKAVRAQGFGEEFLRLWRFYLAYCEAGFRAGSTDVYHFELAHAASGGGA